jgi:hypothetical protein
LPEHDDLPVGRAVAGGHREARCELAVGKTNFWLRPARIGLLHVIGALALLPLLRGVEDAQYQ